MQHPVLKNSAYDSINNNAEREAAYDSVDTLEHEVAHEREPRYLNLETKDNPTPVVELDT